MTFFLCNTKCMEGQIWKWNMPILKLHLGLSRFCATVCKSNTFVNIGRNQTAPGVVHFKVQVCLIPELYHVNDVYTSSQRLDINILLLLSYKDFQWPFYLMTMMMMIKEQCQKLVVLIHILVFYFSYYLRGVGFSSRNRRKFLEHTLTPYSRLQYYLTTTNMLNIGCFIKWNWTRII